MNRSERRRQEKLAQKQQNTGTGQGPINDLLAQGVAHHQKGELPQAEAKYQAILKINPQHGDANHLMGLLAKQVGKFDIAKQLIEKALLANPNHPQYLNNMGAVLKDLGDLESAKTHHELAIKANPQFAQAYNSLGIVEKALERFDEARSAFEKALELQPQFPEALSNFGNLYVELGEPERGLNYIDLALKLAPKFLDGQFNRAHALQQQGRIDEAQTQYKALIEMSPKFAPAYRNLGLLHKDNGQLGIAVELLQKAAELEPQNPDHYYNLGLALAEAGDYTDALACFEGAYTLNPEHAHAFNDHGNALFAMGRSKEASTSYAKALELAPNSAGMHNNAGNAFLRRGMLEAARSEFERALELRPDHASAHNNMGVLHQEYGEFAEAQFHYEQAIAAKPRYAEAFSNMLFTMNYDPGKSGEEIFEWYKKYNEVFAEPLQHMQQPHANSKDPKRRLRVGYVCSTFYKHSTHHFLLPLFEHAMRDEFEIYAYADLNKSDEFTAQYKSHCDHWITTNELSDHALAERIRDDQIDILIDISGHAKGNRLPTFAEKPAPVSLHWLDFGYTTGMDAIDYYLGDPLVTPEHDDHLFGEGAVWRMEGPSFVYRPGPGMGDVSPLPAKENGFVTFCSLSRTVRLNDKTLRVWAEILKQVEGSKLRLDSRNFEDAQMCNLIAEKFAKFGIERDRLIMGFHSPPWDVLREVDIALDCFPHNSGTTLVEHLYMGNPFVTLYARASVGTLGGAILTNLGLEDWVAKTEQNYIEIATQLAQDLDQLEHIRTGLRKKLQNSPAMDEEGFARRMGQAYRQMWTRYCEAHA
ncbi:putative O-linked N-acetylglucosamine transferase (SPINDLY family) [Maritalea mobilis]|uniref:protein O-GlcNAc transferase n=1 Tax=Maritalea mobilis TaxID=483324 RepID=A0A4R6VKS0_9HYPH|nr:tetratricopeptide repeat protein [Maritalea mobilis]TDQ64075.1 putative O-linked N-acetylglucosamine transferase (SPINDLY family) [Maritalea mobilis]